MSLLRARELADTLGRWAASDDAAEPEAPATRRAMRTAAELVYVLMDVERAAEERVLRFSYPFARTRGHCLHVLGCSATRASAVYRPLTTSKAEAFLRNRTSAAAARCASRTFPSPRGSRYGRTAGGPAGGANDVKLP